MTSDSCDQQRPRRRRNTPPPSDLARCGPPDCHTRHADERHREELTPGRACVVCEGLDRGWRPKLMTIPKTARGTIAFDSHRWVDTAIGRSPSRNTPAAIQITRPRRRPNRGGPDRLRRRVRAPRPDAPMNSPASGAILTAQIWSANTGIRMESAGHSREGSASQEQAAWPRIGVGRPV